MSSDTAPHAFPGIRLGAHESIAGGLFKALERGAEHGAEAVQIFTKSARGWACKPLSEDDVTLYRKTASNSGLPSAAHASYLVNLAAEPGEQREKSLAAMADDWQRANALGLLGLVVHPGSNVDVGRGRALVAEAVAELHRRVPVGPSQLLIENTAGQGSSLGWSLDGLFDLFTAIDALGPWTRSRVGLCLDTCHLFAAGHDLSTEAAYLRTFEAIEERLGLERISAFHLNDSKGPLGCRLDRHQNIGEGHIGEAGFAALINDSRFAGIPGFLETDEGEQIKNLTRLRKLRA